MTPLYNDIIGKLPWELFEITLGFLHICDVVRCRQVCPNSYTSRHRGQNIVLVIACLL